MSTGFLITSLTTKLRKLSDVVNQNVLKKLYVYISVKENQPDIKNIEWESTKIADMYSSSFHLFPNLDVRIILNELKLHNEEKIPKIEDYDIDVILLPKNYTKANISYLKSQKKSLTVLYVEDLIDEEVNVNAVVSKKYDNVVLGGTFDRLHAGHKILLSEAILRCSKKLTVGVTDTNMIKGKTLWELIEPCTKRIQEVENFIKDVDVSIECEVVPITDMYGPTGVDPHLNMIVVSSETLKGGLKVNELRTKNGLNELDIHVVNLVEDSNRSDEEEQKIGSSNLRKRLLGMHLRTPTTEKACISSKPYIIGLTGGVASGKSSICAYLAELGAGIVDCDKIGHQLYKQGSDIYYELIKVFGNDIVSENGEINRKKLGGIVFKDVDKLELLNNLMWPAIMKAAMTECERLYTEDKKEIVILEAAVLIRANWHKNVHEVWATIIPQVEAIDRLIKRNNLTEEEARLRIQSQPSNSEIVEVANVVFCSLWSYEFTRRQVDKAWRTVQSVMTGV